MKERKNLSKASICLKTREKHQVLYNDREVTQVLTSFNHSFTCKLTTMIGTEYIRNIGPEIWFRVAEYMSGMYEILNSVLAL